MVQTFGLAENKEFGDAMSPEQTIKSMPESDPTALTTEQLTRTVASVKEMFAVQIAAEHESLELLKQEIKSLPCEMDKTVDHLKGFIEARLNGMDKATQLLQSGADLIPARMDEKIAALKVLHEERFNSIKTQFLERDVRTEQSSKDSKVAVDAALQAAKEAVGEQNKSSALAISKSEAATTKQIDQIGAAMASQSKNVDDKFSDMKDRLTAIENRGTGRQDSWGWLVGAVGMVVGVIAVVLMIVKAAH
jgi:hypothetical protein